jgi:hypothetical protein
MANIISLSLNKKRDLLLKEQIPLLNQKLISKNSQLKLNKSVLQTIPLQPKTKPKPLQILQKLIIPSKIKKNLFH